MLRSAITPVLGTFQLVALAGCQGGRESTTGGRTRTYYLAADELEWTYVPSRGDQAITGKTDDFANNPASAGMLDPNQSTYRKAVFRYADSSFRTLKPRTDQWMHLGILGPVLRAQVGDTIRVVFRNNATRPYSLHPHGVLYPKSAEGFAYLDSTLSRARLDDSIPAGGTYTYVWPVPERAGPPALCGVA